MFVWRGRLQRVGDEGAEALSDAGGLSHVLLPQRGEASESLHVVEGLLSLGVDMTTTKL